MIWHKKESLPVVVCRDGRPGWVMPEALGFLGLNGCDLEAGDSDVVTEMLALADGRVSEGGAG